jgi:hypothetical protein
MALSTRTNRRPTTADQAMPDRRDWRQTEWAGLQFATPAEWEILAHSVNVRQGRLALADRRQQRMQLSWATTDRRPDLAHALEDYRSRDLNEDQSLVFASIDGCGDWLGHHRKGLSRLTRYQTDRRLWIELVLTWPGRYQPGIERAIAESIVSVIDTPADDENAACAAGLRWRGFGIDVVSPPRLALVKAEIKPADTTFRFAHVDRSRCEAQLHRAGMLDDWFDGNLEGFIRRRVGLGPEITFTRTTWNDGAACLGQSVEPTTNFRRVTGQARDRTDLAWTDAPAHAAYCLTILSRDPADHQTDAWACHGYSTR